jgi:3-hydroxyisobutyrate dehydrogenase-like beta-hydroxyacid dehydrogenase
MEKLGVIGLGNIGSRFAERLLNTGYPVTALDTDPEKMAAAVALGARPASTPGEVAADSDIILLCLPGSHAVENVMEGPDGIMGHLRAGHLIVDTGTTHPKTDIHYSRRCQESDAGLIDAPITGRSKGYIMMVGGRAEDFAKAESVLTGLSCKLKHIGPVGHGQVLKLMNQMVLAGQWAVWAEAITWGAEAGVEPRLLRDYLEFPVDEGLFGDDFHGGGTLALHYKDLGYVLDLAHEIGAAIPVTNVVHEAFKATKNAAAPDWTQTGIVTYWRRLNESRRGGRRRARE